MFVYQYKKLITLQFLRCISLKFRSSWYETIFLSRLLTENVLVTDKMITLYLYTCTPVLSIHIEGIGDLDFFSLSITLKS